MKTIGSLFSKFKNVRTRNKLLISYLLVVFIPVLAVGLILTSGMRQMALNQAVREATVNVDRLEKSVSDILRTPDDFSNILLTDKTLQRIVSRQYQNTIEVVEAYQEYSRFDDYLRLYKSIAGIMLYTDNDTILENWRFMRTNDQIRNSWWYETALRNKGAVSWNFICNPAKGKCFFSMTRSIEYMNRPVGVLVIDIDGYYLDSIIRKEPFETIIVDENGTIAAAKDESLKGRNLKDLNLEENIMATDSGIFQANYRGKVSKIIVNTFTPDGSISKLKVICVFPVDSIVGGADRTGFIGFSIIAASLLVSLIFILVFSNVLSRRLKHLSRDVHKVATGDFNISSAIDGSDEIGQLARDLNSMAQSLEKLLAEVREANMQKNQLALQKNQLIIKQKEIKLKMLASQINPHFLFNTLETIRMKIHSAGEPETADIVALLGKLMRRNLEIGSELTALGEETDVVRSYLEIQKFRYGCKLNYEINVCEGIMDYRIIPLVIQPLVENAVIHGLENRKGEGRISVDIACGDGTLRISVADNGIGIEQANLVNIRQSLNEAEDESSKKIGLKNIHQRLKLYYGDEYGLEISSTPGQGTRVDIALPVYRESPEGFMARRSS